MNNKIMDNNIYFNSSILCDWKKKIPQPICEDVPDYDMLYQKAWELAHDHIRYIDGMPQSPYMDEAFCDTQLWIWDTCFMSLFCKYAQDEFPGVESLRNFYDVLYGEKNLPYVIPSSNEPSWTGALPGVPSQIKIHIADNPPLFAFAEYENALFHGDVDYIRDLLYNRGVLQKHYEWIEGLKNSELPRGVRASTCLINENIGYRWEGGRSGMDNTPRGKTTKRTLKERPNNPNMLWIDAICQQALSAKMIANLYGIVGDTENRMKWERLYNEKKEIVNRYYWDEEDGFYYDIDCDSHSFYKVMTPASYWALLAGIAFDDRAQAMVAKILDKNTLGGNLPLISLSRSDDNFENDGRYWRGGLWLPTAYAALKGIEKYGYYDTAHNAARKILDHMLMTYVEYEPHTIWECYSPNAPAPSTVANGESIVRGDFCGWSALGPISMYIEEVIGFHTINAFERVVEWQKPNEFKKALGIKNLHFADVVTDIVAEGNVCTVKSNQSYVLKINGKTFSILEGEQKFTL
jgi:glycogen debranching enzyme